MNSVLDSSYSMKLIAIFEFLIEISLKADFQKLPL